MITPGSASGTAVAELAGDLRRDPADPTVLVMSGEVDVEVAQDARRRLADFDGVLVVDMSAVTFVDSAGLGLLMVLARRARPARLHLRDAGSQAVSMLTLLGAHRVVDITPAR